MYNLICCESEKLCLGGFPQPSASAAFCCVATQVMRVYCGGHVVQQKVSGLQNRVCSSCHDNQNPKDLTSARSISKAHAQTRRFYMKSSVFLHFQQSALIVRRQMDRKTHIIYTMYVWICMVIHHDTQSPHMCACNWLPCCCARTYSGCSRY